MLLGIQDANANDITGNPVLATSYGFTGRELDSESGLMFHRARYCDQSSGRFLQKDPSSGKLTSPSSVTNQYIYAANSPIKYGDASGKSIFGDALSWFIDPYIQAVGAVAGLIGGDIGNWVHNAVTSDTFRMMEIMVAASV